MKLKRKSWHYWLVKFGQSDVRYTSSTDICTYTKAVAKGALVLTIMAVVGALLTGVGLFALIAMGYAIGWFATGMEGGWSFPPEIVKVGLILWFVVIVVAAWAAFCVRRTKHRPGAVRNAQPGFLKLAFQSWRGKFCVKIDLE